MPLVIDYISLLFEFIIDFYCLLNYYLKNHIYLILRTKFNKFDLIIY